MLKAVLLDMDGVLVDFHGGILKLFGREDLITDYPAGQYWINEPLGISEEDLFARLEKEGPEWWASLDQLPWALALYESLTHAVGPRVYFCTSPTQDPASCAGKLAWMQQFIGDPEFRNFFITPAKELLAGPDVVLIDDDPDNFKKFVRSGGKAIEFPARWSGYSNEEIDKFVDTAVSRISELHNG